VLKLLLNLGTRESRNLIFQKEKKSSRGCRQRKGKLKSSNCELLFQSVLSFSVIPIIKC